MEKKPRLIFHCDCNNFFASCEILEQPGLRDVPMAVAGDPENRLGVVVAKNELAKKRGVKTTDTVWQAKKSIHTIGDLAMQPKERIQALLGKGGEMLWQYANGLDTEKVRQWGDKPEIKSVSRGMTFKRDLIKKEEIMAGISALADEIAASLRRHQLKGSVISVQIKAPDLRVISRQTSFKRRKRT